MEQRDVWSLIERHHTRERTAQYLAAAAHDRRLATELLRWNGRLSAAMWVSLGHVEVALRNTIDRQMTVRAERLGRQQHWLLDEASELGRARRPGDRHRRPYLEVDAAISRVRRNAHPPDAGQIVSELPFGFWHQMLSKQQRSVWPDLAGGFPGAPSRAQALVHDPVARLRSFPNRVAHHHAIWTYDIHARWSDIIQVATSIDPELAAWVRSESSTPRILAERPCTPPAPGSP